MSSTRPIYLRLPSLRTNITVGLLFLLAACSDDGASKAEVPASSGGVNGESPSMSGGSSGSDGSGSSGNTTSTGGSASIGTGGSSSGGASSEATGGQDNGSGGVPSAGGSQSSGGQDASGGEPWGSGGMAEEIFDPCPATGPCKILPLGDSITVGWGSSHGGSYRLELFRLAHSAGRDITFVGTQPPSGPNAVDGVAFPRKHEGIAGETISEIMGRVDGALNSEIPHIVVLHAGTNDMSKGPQGADTRLATLVDKLINDLPDALIVVSNIIPFPQYGSQVSSFNATVKPMLEDRIQDGAHIVFVDQFTGFPTSELGDGVHPTDAGYLRMGGKWYDAIEDYL